MLRSTCPPLLFLLRHLPVERRKLRRLLLSQRPLLRQLLQHHRGHRGRKQVVSGTRVRTATQVTSQVTDQFPPQLLHLLIPQVRRARHQLVCHHIPERLRLLKRPQNLIRSSVHSRASREAREVTLEEPDAVVGAVSPGGLLPGQDRRRRAPSRFGRRSWIVSGTGFTPSPPGWIQISARAGPSTCRNGSGAVSPTSSVPERASLGRSLCARSSVSCRSCVTGEKPGPACAVSSDCAV